jgi:hypothetical protein
LRTRALPTRIKSVRNPGRGSRRAKRDVLSALALHKQLNPTRGLPILVGIDQATGQLFFTAATGLSSRRSDEVADRRPYYDRCTDA